MNSYHFLSFSVAGVGAKKNYYNCVDLSVSVEMWVSTYYRKCLIELQGLYSASEWHQCLEMKTVNATHFLLLVYKS